MAIKDLLVAYDGNDASQKAVQLAVQMSRKYDAAITGVHIFRTETYESHIRRWIPDDVLERMKDAELGAERTIESGFRDHLAEAGYDGDAQWITTQGQANILLPRFARYFDLMLIGQFTSAWGNERRTVQPEELVTRAGKPVIVVPKGLDVRPFKEEAVMSWDGSRSASRALSDAMQILETKKRLDVVTVDTDGVAGTAALPPEIDVIAHLERHGINAKAVRLKSTGQSVGKLVLDYCAETAPDMLVMGAFGRGKLGDMLFGGVTRHILQNMTVPVLISH